MLRCLGQFCYSVGSQVLEAYAYTLDFLEGRILALQVLVFLYHVNLIRSSAES